MARHRLPDQSRINGGTILPSAAWPLNIPGDEVSSTVGQLCDQLGNGVDSLLQLLVRLQYRFGRIDDGVTEAVCRQLPLLPADVRALVDFYSFLNSEFQGQYQLLLSNNVTDSSSGHRHVLRRFRQLLKIPDNGVRQDGRVSISVTSCVGLCDQGPAALINGHPLTRLSAGRIEEISRRIEALSPLSEWPGHWFKVSDCVRQSGPLLKRKLIPGQAIRKFLALPAGAFLEQLQRSRLRGRGGAGFSSWQKLASVRSAQAGRRFVICNADEGEPGTFKDRVLLNKHIEQVIEGMTLAAHTLKAELGFIYLRGEYAWLLPQLSAALSSRRKSGWLGKHIGGSKDFSFDISVHLGAGAYVCGEETALIESLEGRRGVPRTRPPFPVSHGYKLQPTLVSNVETFACMTEIALTGGESFARTGTEQSTGFRLHSISGDCALPGIYELPWGISVREVLRRCGGSEAVAVQVGGPSGTLLLASDFDKTLAFEDIPSGGSFMVFGADRDLQGVVTAFNEFFAHESCGFCAPCRVGCQQLVSLCERLKRRPLRMEEIQQIPELHSLMTRASHCGLGKTASAPLFQLFELGKIPCSAIGEETVGLDLARATAEAAGLKETS